MRLVQVARAENRRVGLVEGEQIRLLDERRCTSVYALAMRAAQEGRELQTLVGDAVGHDSLSYDSVYEGNSPWRLLPSFDHPEDAARCVVSGTGLTHKASAENRAAMHKQKEAEITDSMRMYRLGLEGGSPPPGEIGVQPEWFFKGDGSIIRAHGDTLEIPPYGIDGGEEPEIAGVYIIAPNGQPRRVGVTVGNEFSDHRMEKENYLYLAPSKLRNCSIGPELTIGEMTFDNIEGTVSIHRGGSPLWQKEIWTGENNMSHTVANLEHHHFKYKAHRRPADVHIHFFGADAFSFGESIELKAGDQMEVSFPQFGRALRNFLTIASVPDKLVAIEPL